MKKRNKILMGFIIPFIVLIASICGIGLGLPNGNSISSYSITAGASVERGGAVFLKSGASYTMNGGSIRNKKATYGGAVYVSDDSTFNMNGGTISGNTASIGSGVYVASGGTFNMSGGTMEDEVFTAGSMVYTGGTVSGTITLAGAENLTIGTVPAEPLNIVAQTTAVGTKLIKVTADDFDLSDVNISGLPTGRRVILSGGYVVVDYVYYTITWKNYDGTVLETDTVAHGTVPTYNGATPTKASTAQYSYSFKSWDSTPVAATANKTYTATFNSALRSYTITIAVSPSGYGSVSKTSVTVNYGTSISASGATLTIGSNTITATATSATAQYSYAFSSWSNAGTSVTGAKTITANFTRTTNQYTVTLGAGLGLWSSSTAIKVDYGTAISVSSNKLTVGSITRTFTASADTAQYDYTFNSLGGAPSGGKVIANVTITPSVSRVTKSYTLSYSNGYYYATNATDITVTASSGTLSRSTINGTNTTFTLTAEYSTEPITITFTRKNTDRNYYVWWSGSSGAENTTSRTWTPTANESNAWYLREFYTVTASAGTGVSSASFSGTDCWGNSIASTTSATLLYGASLKFSASVSTGYTWSKWSDGSTTQTDYAVTTSLNSDINLTARAKINSYTVTLASGYGSWDTSTAITATYGTAISVSSNKLTVGSTTRTWTTSSDTAQYDYTFNSLSLSPSGSTVTQNVTVTPSVSRATKTYTVTWKNGNTTLETDKGVAYGTTPTYNGATPTKESTVEYSYTFSGWSPSVGAITGTTTYTAQFTETLRTYTVTWKNYDGTVLETDTGVAYGTTPKYNGATPTKAQDAQYTYTFSGWSPDVGAITGATTYTAQFTATLRTYTVTWKNGSTILETDTGVAYGTPAKYNGATPTKSQDAQYTYTFSGWSPSVGAVTGDTTYTAQFTTTTRTYTVTWKNHNGAVLESDTGVAYGTTPTYNGATPTKSSTAQYSYTFSGWSPSVGAITGATTYTAQFTATTRTYTVTWKNGSTTLETDTGVAYGTTPTYNGATPTKAQDAQYTYTFSGWSPSVGAITGATTYTAQFTATLRSYTITIAVNTSGYGTVSKTSVTVNYGTSISTSGTTLTIGSNTITATPTTATAQYSYAFSSWSNAGTSVTGAKTITANFTQTLRTYTVTWEDGYYNVIEVDYNVPYGTTPTFNGGDLSHDQGDYYAEHVGWYPEIRPVTGDIIYEAAYNMSINQYTLTFNISPSSSGYFTDSNGTTYSGNSMSLTVCYGTEYTVSGNQIYLIDNYSGSGFELTIYAHANSGYNFDTWSWGDSSGTIESDKSITAYFERSVVYYDMRFVIDGINEFYRPGYLTDGYEGAYEFSASVVAGTSYTVNDNCILITGCGTVYAFAVEGYEFVSWEGGDEEGYVDCDMTFHAVFLAATGGSYVTITAFGEGSIVVEDMTTGETLYRGYSITLDMSKYTRLENYGEELIIGERYRVYPTDTDYFYGFYSVGEYAFEDEIVEEHRIIYADFGENEIGNKANINFESEYGGILNYEFTPGTMIRIYGSGRVEALKFDQYGNLIYIQSIYPALGLDGQTPLYIYIATPNGEHSTGFYAHDNFDEIVMYQFFVTSESMVIQFFTSY